MNRDFEIKQLLRAFRGGIMSEAAFEEEITRLEHESAGQDQTSNPPPFEACGRSYRSERDGVLSFLDELHAAQMDSAVGFAKWSAVCRTKGLRTGLLVAAERAAYHTRIIQRRMHELAGELHATTSEQGQRLIEVLANSQISDVEKLAALAPMIQEPQRSIAPLLAFAAALANDLETKQALRLIAEDELSTASWLQEVYGAMTTMQPNATAAPAPQQ
ncbi:MAG TPA: hypothetical protein VMU41_03340 [Candidatus Binataceae bacterium]|nr:hypothetical protein [Candidatus Binataceae bacterium]